MKIFSNRDHITCIFLYVNAYTRVLTLYTVFCRIVQKKIMKKVEKNSLFELCKSASEREKEKNGSIEISCLACAFLSF